MKNNNCSTIPKIIGIKLDLKLIDSPSPDFHNSLSKVIHEIVNNSWDANANEVVITLIDKDMDKIIVVSDDGYGMTFEDINGKLLKLNRNKREEDSGVLFRINSKGRQIIGGRAIGKLYIFWIAEEVEFTTVRNYIQNSIIMSFSNIKQENNIHFPKLSIYNLKVEIKQGTTVTLSKIKFDGKFDIDRLYNDISNFGFVRYTHNDYKSFHPHVEYLNENKIKISF